ncbi:MAG: antitoxin [Solirubrobacteraceae bacterium]
MKFGDKFKDLRKQAQDVVAENREKIHDAVDVVSTTVDQKTGGKHTAKIAKFGEQAGAAVDRFGERDGEEVGKPRPADGSSPPASSGASGSASPGTAGSAPDAAAGPTPTGDGEHYGGMPPTFDE